MIGFLKTVFSRKKPKVESTGPAKNTDGDSRSAAKVDSTQASSGRLLFAELPVDIDLYFSAWMLGADVAIEIAPGKLERQILKSVESVMKLELNESNLLPRVPAIIPQLLRSLRNENVNTADIVQEISQDPTIVGEVIRLANSAYYGTKVPTSSLEQALVKLGHNGLRQMVSNIAFRSIIDVRAGQFLGLGSPLLWKQTERSAHAARYLAAFEGEDTFDAYLAALVQNIGMTVALKVLDDHLTINDAPRSTAFHRALGVLARRLTLHIVKSWNFPPGIIKAIQEQVNIESVDTTSRLGTIIYEADRLSRLFLLERNRRIQIDLEQIFGNPESGDESKYAKCYRELDALGDEFD